MKMRLLVIVLLALVWAGCSDVSSSSDYNSDPDRFIKSETDTLEGMVRIFAKGASTILGTNDAEAKKNEKPAMKVEFTYDFSIGRREMTCGEYNELMEHEVKCSNKKFPIGNVTYYDAVLLANARSKKEGFDTAYTYEKAVFDYGGHCTNLEGFTFHPEVEAYRLPTEAEWVLAATQGWSYVKAWTAENSAYSGQLGCTQPANGIHLCDMVGNLMEWVNDWLGNFSDTVVTNFVGAPDGGGVGERVVKGGSFRDNGLAITPFNRGDVYMVSSATKQGYIGFRLAFGSIPDPTWMDRSGKSNTSRVTPISGSTALREKSGANKLKLVFRNDVTGNLVYFNYSSALPVTYEFNDSVDAYHPEISPDGNWVAYCTGVEGIDGKSKVYVRRLDAPDKAALKLDVEKAAIPRWLVRSSGDTVIVYVSDASNNAEDADFKKMSTWEVPFAGGKFGAPEKLFDGAYHDGISVDGTLAVTGSSKLRARIAKSGNVGEFIDTVWYAGEQACNASLAKDGSKRVSFLDFGGKPGRDFVGSKYKTHERILIADSTGKLVHSVAAPSGYTFDHSEWSGEGFVAVLVNANGAHVKIVYVDPEDGSYVTLAEGDELWHPSLWQKGNSSSNSGKLLDLDSAGVYYRESAEDYVYVFREKMEDFWTMKDSVDVIAMGSSRVMYGIYYKEFPTHVVLNMAYPGADMYDARYIFLNYVLQHMTNLKYLILEVAPDMFYRQASSHWIPMYQSVPGIAYDAHHGFWASGIPEGFIEAVKDCPTYPDLDNLPYDEDFMYPARSWGKAVLMADSTYSLVDDDLVETSMGAYGEIIDAALEAGIKIIGVVFPRHPEYRKTGSYGAYGPMRSYAKRILDRVAMFDMVILDENKWGEHDYTDEMAYDYDHLSIEGAKQLSRRVDSLLRTLE